jgi:predicted aldo/keto reductase-like oxidoreductase
MISKRAIGQTRESASILGFGTLRLPLKSEDPEDIDKDLAIDMIRTAIDQGVNYVDTAYPYHSRLNRNNPGASEPFVGEALADGYRQKVLLATKLPTWMVNSRSDMDKFLDEQLKRLKVAQLDFYLAHGLNIVVWDKLVELGLKDFLDCAVKDGRIRYPAFSFHDYYALFERIIESYDWSMCLIQYNYLDRDFQAGQKGLKLANSKGMGVLIMEPLRGGFLTNQMPPQPTALLENARPNWSLAAWSFYWLWNQPEVTAVLSGMSTKEQVLENLSLANSWKKGLITPVDIEVLDNIYDYFVSRLKTRCTACSYCMPCPYGVNIPKNLTLLNKFFLEDSEESINKCYDLYYSQLKSSEMANNCLYCHECEEKCPQHIAIPEFLQYTAKVYTKRHI